MLFTGISIKKHYLPLRSMPVFLVLIFCLLIQGGCSVKVLNRRLVEPDKTKHLYSKSQYLKVHMLNGQVYILTDWSVDEDTRYVLGTGKLLDINREVIGDDHYSISIDSVAIFETNTVQTSPSVGGMAVLTGASLAVTIYCIANPKACFGSCPTFYVDNGDEFILQAEGFSSSVAPCLEAFDIDALYRAEASDTMFDVIMKNEALETHVVRYVDLLAVPRSNDSRVFVSGEGSFYLVDSVTSPTMCTAMEGDCLSKLNTFDGNERVSETDSFYLAEKETIDLRFECAPDSNPGLIIAFRQSLVSTYLFYQTLAYMGSTVAEWIAKLESGNMLALQKAQDLGMILGGIEIFIKDNQGNWIPAGEIRETGPLATNISITPLPAIAEDAIDIRLKLAKGNWRLDYIALASIKKKVTPIRLKPDIVICDSSPDYNALDILHDSSRVLVTLPGDEYTLQYSFPDAFDQYELFLQSRGYYLEWIRDEWLKEENQAKAAMMFFDPEKALQDLALEFKKIEADMEDLFWGSKYAR
jgi:hypothetical protein